MLSITVPATPAGTATFHYEPDFARALRTAVSMLPDITPTARIEVRLEPGTVIWNTAPTADIRTKLWLHADGFWWLEGIGSDGPTYTTALLKLKALPLRPSKTPTPATSTSAASTPSASDVSDLL